MCGIFGYFGSANAAEKSAHGLRRLEYRGYDSWGIATVMDGDLEIIKEVGRIPDKIPSLQKWGKVTAAVAHTRWATHGGVTKTNAHPHLSATGDFAVVHNGIVENYLELKKMLGPKVTFKTQTDTEVIVKLLERELAKPTKKNQSFELDQLVTAVRQVMKELAGRNTFLVLTKQGDMAAVRQGSPLVVGLTTNPGEIYISSDVLSFADVAQRVVAIDNGQLVAWQAGQAELELYDIDTGSSISWQAQPIQVKQATLDKAGFDHFMIKEIHETPQVIRTVTTQSAASIEKLATAIRQARRVFTIGSGTAGVAAGLMAAYLRSQGQVLAMSLVGAEAGEVLPLMNDQDILIALSQSGETADVLEVLEKAQAKGVKLVCYVNMPGSSMTRLADLSFMADAGPEVCVMSTKVLSSQAAWGYLVAKAVAGQYAAGKKNLNNVADQLQTYLALPETHKICRNWATQLAKVNDIFLLGKGEAAYSVMEGMIKLIEGSYKHAHAIPAGDLKHYAITLMEEGVPVIVVVPEAETERLAVMNAAQEVKARGATVFAISAQEHPVFDYWMPLPATGETLAITCVVPLQLLAYYLTVKLGNDVDHPRNIAKSVTVK
jgi:glucosamine--fructose-6-phosphate aminotransferase (isomerizing)